MFLVKKQGFINMVNIEHSFFFKFEKKSVFCMFFDAASFTPFVFVIHMQLCEVFETDITDVYICTALSLLFWHLNWNYRK